VGFHAAGATTQVAKDLASGFAANGLNQPAGAASTGSASAATVATPAVDYFVDAMFRPALNGSMAGGGQAPTSAPTTVGIGAAGAQPALSPEARAEVSRIVARSVAQGRLDDNDKVYLAQMVSARTGLPPDEAQRRVTETEAKARDNAKDIADKAAKTGAYLSFWTFMSLLFGVVAATLAGMLGGQLRDAEERAA
jgi:hypothetical protein